MSWRAWSWIAVLLYLKRAVSEPLQPCIFEAWGIGICDVLRRTNAARLAAVAAERQPWPTACPRRPLPSSPAELRAVMRAGVPTILTGASAAFGEEVARWRDVEGHFLRRHGDVQLMAAVANASEMSASGARLGTQPLFNATGVGYPHKIRLSLRAFHDMMLASPRTGRRAWVEQSMMYPHGALFRDIDFRAMRPTLFDPYAQLSQANLWYGLTELAPKESVLHHDNSRENLLLQLAGRKKVRCCCWVLLTPPAPFQLQPGPHCETARIQVVQRSLCVVAHFARPASYRTCLSLAQLALFNPLDSHLLYPHTMRSYKGHNPFYRGKRDVLSRWESWSLQVLSRCCSAPIPLHARNLSMR